MQGLAGRQGPPGGPTLAPLRISEIDSVSGTQLKTGFLHVGADLYTDDDGITFKSVPVEVAGQPYILTADSDKGLTGASALTFTVNIYVYIYIYIYTHTCI
jgi:hypothetical protein